MNAEQFLNEALGGNMNISTLKPLAWHEIMESYAQHKIKEVAHSASDNNARDAIAGDTAFSVRCSCGAAISLRIHVDGGSTAPVAQTVVVNKIFPGGYSWTQRT